MDKNKAALGIKDYSVRSSTLEEVFISLGEAEKAKEFGEQNLANGPGSSYSPTI